MVLQYADSGNFEDYISYINKKEWIRRSNKKVALKCLNNSQNMINEFLNEV